MFNFIVSDDRGAVTTDWVALSAGVIVLGMVVAYSVLGGSHQMVLDSFVALDTEFDSVAVDVAAVGQSIDIDQ